MKTQIAPIISPLHTAVKAVLHPCEHPCLSCSNHLPEQLTKRLHHDDLAIMNTLKPISNQILTMFRQICAIIYLYCSARSGS